MHSEASRETTHLGPPLPSTSPAAGVLGPGQRVPPAALTGHRRRAQGLPVNMAFPRLRSEPSLRPPLLWSGLGFPLCSVRNLLLFAGYLHGALFERIQEPDKTSYPVHTSAPPTLWKSLLLGRVKAGPGL